MHVGMEHEENSNIENNECIVDPDSGQSKESKLHGYKLVCAKLGLSMCFYFCFRLLAGWVSILFGNYSGTINETVYILLNYFITIVLVYVIPLLFTAWIFKSFTNYKGKYRELYAKPKRFARAMGTFPAAYGFGYGIALLTMLVMYLISRNVSGHAYIEELLRPTALEPTSNLAGLFSLIFMLVIIAPLFEEIWVRGIMYDALKPYGTGIAIIISSIVFGFMHGNIYMLFYTTALGFALGYIRYATNSLLIVTILHALINSISAGLLTVISLDQITDGQSRIVNTISNVYSIAVLALIIVSVVIFLSKIPKIKKYRFENPWTEIGPWKKTALFFFSIPVILMMVLVFNDLSLGLLIRTLIR